VIVVVPAATGVTIPSDTAATSSLLEVHVTFLLVALDGSTAAVNIPISPPVIKLNDVRLRLKPVAATVLEPLSLSLSLSLLVDGIVWVFVIDSVTSLPPAITVVSGASVNLTGVCSICIPGLFTVAFSMMPFPATFTTASSFKDVTFTSFPRLTVVFAAVSVIFKASNVPLATSIEAAFDRISTVLKFPASVTGLVVVFRLSDKTTFPNPFPLN